MKTDNETRIRHAAERLRDHAWAMNPNVHGATTPYIYGGGFDPLAREADQKTLADAYLADHPADSDTPIDEAWLRSVGFVEYSGSKNNVCLSLWIDRKLHNVAFVAVHWPIVESVEPYWSVQGYSMYKPAYPKTRGDLRRLCKALGIELKESL